MNSLDDQYILMFQEWDISTKINMNKDQMRITEEETRQQILKSCSYLEIISNPHLKSAMGW